MDFKVLYTEPALADLEALMRGSWERYPATSERFADSLLNHIDLLKDFPYVGAPVRGYAGVRQLVHSPLRVYYRLDEEKRVVEILNIRHGARWYPGL